MMFFKKSNQEDAIIPPPPPFPGITEEKLEKKFDFTEFIKKESKTKQKKEKTALDLGLEQLEQESLNLTKEKKPKVKKQLFLKKTSETEAVPKPAKKPKIFSNIKKSLFDLFKPKETFKPEQLPTKKKLPKLKKPPKLKETPEKDSSEKPKIFSNIKKSLFDLFKPKETFKPEQLPPLKKPPKLKETPGKISLPNLKKTPLARPSEIYLAKQEIAKEIEDLKNPPKKDNSKKPKIFNNLKQSLLDLFKPKETSKPEQLPTKKKLPKLKKPPKPKEISEKEIHLPDLEETPVENLPEIFLAEKEIEDIEKISEKDNSKKPKIFNNLKQSLLDLFKPKETSKPEQLPTKKKPSKPKNPPEKDNSKKPETSDQPKQSLLDLFKPKETSKPEQISTKKKLPKLKKPPKLKEIPEEIPLPNLKKTPLARPSEISLAKQETAQEIEDLEKTPKKDSSEKPKIFSNIKKSLFDLFKPKETFKPEQLPTKKKLPKIKEAPEEIHLPDLEKTQFEKPYEIILAEQEIAKAIEGLKKIPKKYGSDKSKTSGKPKKLLFSLFKPKEDPPQDKIKLQKIPQEKLQKEQPLMEKFQFPEKLPPPEIKEPRDEITIINHKIHDIRDALMDFDLTKAKLIYIKTMGMYKNLTPEKQAIVYEQIKDIYNERKNAESLNIKS